jgi:hypothetical protein
MMADQVRNALRAQPFAPFAFRLADGSRHVVASPDHLAIPPVEHPREIVYYSVIDGGGDDYRTHWINVGLITEIVVPADVAGLTQLEGGSD